MKKDLFDLSAEITGVAMIIGGLSNQLDNEKTESLTETAMRNALFGVTSHLNRIAEDLNEVMKEGD